VLLHQGVRFAFRVHQVQQTEEPHRFYHFLLFRSRM
jgi:hypothetical protein